MPSGSDRALGWYHIAGALAGLGMTLWAASRGAALPGGGLWWALAPFTLSAVAGRALLRAAPRARGLAAAAQAVQVPVVVLPSVAWKCVAGLIASVTLNPAGVGLYAGVEATWLVGAGRLPTGLPPALGLNLVPLLVIGLLFAPRGRQTAAPSRAAA